MDLCSESPFEKIKIGVGPFSTRPVATRPIQENRKRRLSFLAETVSPRRVTQDSCFTDKMVKRTPQVVGDFSDQHRPDSRVITGLGSDAETLLAGIRVDLGWDNSIGIDLEETLGSQVKRVDLFLSTVNLGDSSVKRMHKLYLSHERSKGRQTE